jgi:hypothetical protein
MPIVIDIDVTLLDKARFKRITRKSGQPAVFANLVLFDKPDAHGNDGFVKQSQTKEERDRGDSQLPILGNWKHLGEKRNAPALAPAPKPAAPAPEMAEDDIPF